jgi:tryptophan 2,3-dioxygenase
MFALLVIHLRAAIFSAASNYFPEAIKCMTHATRTLTDSKPLFSLLATMQQGAFSEFRKYTDGASAIQSRNYKALESLCREPDVERLHSIAYDSVPDVQRLVLAGQLTLEEAVHDVRTKYALDAGVEHELLAAMTDFGQAMSDWRRTHYKLARHFLALNSGVPAAPSGTGGTEGTEYLGRVRSIPIFRDLDSVRVDESAAIDDSETASEAELTGD